MKKVCVFLADGFEEIEGLTVVDLLRRAKIDVTTVSITGQKIVHGAHNIDVAADILFDEAEYECYDMVVLPGGMPGTIHLGEHEGVRRVITRFDEEEKWIAAICAAPTVFGKMGLLEGRNATCYPGMEEDLLGANKVTDAVAVDGHVVTSRGMGTAIDFSLKLIEVLTDREWANQIGRAIVYL